MPISNSQPSTINEEDILLNLYMDGLTYREIAEIIGRSHTYVFKKISRLKA